MNLPEESYFPMPPFICRKERKSELWELTEPENPLY